MAHPNGGIVLWLMGLAVGGRSVTGYVACPSLSHNRFEFAQRHAEIHDQAGA